MAEPADTPRSAQRPDERPRRKVPRWLALVYASLAAAAVLALFLLPGGAKSSFEVASEGLQRRVECPP